MSVDLVYLSRFNTCCGVSTYTEQLAEAVAKQSIKVSALTSDHASKSHVLREDIPEVPAMVSWSEKNVYRALSDVLDQKPRVIHIQHEFGIFQDTGGLLRLCQRIKEKSPNTKLVLTAHTVPPGIARPEDDFIRTLRLMDAIVVHSRLARKVLCSYPSTFNAPIHIINHGMLPPRERMPKSAAEERLGLKPDKNRLTLLSLGFITRNKKHVLLSQIVSAINQREMIHPRKLFLIIAGMPTPDKEGTALFNTLRLAIDKFGAKDDILLVPKFIPFNDLPAYYGAADMCIHFVERSYHSSSGSIRMDLSYGMPVMAQMAELTQDLSPNTVALFRNESDFMTQLRVVSNKQRLKKMSAEATAMAKNHAWGNTATLHNLLYKKLAGADFGDDVSGRVRAAIFHSCGSLLGGQF